MYLDILCQKVLRVCKRLAKLMPKKDFLKFIYNYHYESIENICIKIVNNIPAKNCSVGKIYKSRETRLALEISLFINDKTGLKINFNWFNVSGSPEYIKNV